MYKNIKFYFLNELLYLGYYLNMLPYLLNIIKRNSKTVFKIIIISGKWCNFLNGNLFIRIVVMEITAVHVQRLRRTMC